LDFSNANLKGDGKEPEVRMKRGTEKRNATTGFAGETLRLSDFPTWEKKKA